MLIDVKGSRGLQHCLTLSDTQTETNTFPPHYRVKGSHLNVLSLASSLYRFILVNVITAV